MSNPDGSFTYSPSSDFSGLVSFIYEIGIPSDLKKNAANGHYYRYVPAPQIHWTEAKELAAQQSINGQAGYLATITSAEENAFIFTEVGGNGWIGASDAGAEGVWHWQTGPEATFRFWTGGPAPGGTPFNGSYSNWHSVEPNDNFPGDNNFPIDRNQGEDYAHIRPTRWYLE